MTPYIKNKRVSWGRIKRLRDKFKDAAVICERVGKNREVVRLVKDGKQVLRYEVVR